MIYRKMLRYISRGFLILSAVFLYLLAPLVDVTYASPLQKLDPVLRELVFSGKLTRLAPGQLAALQLARPHQRALQVAQPAGRRFRHPVAGENQACPARADASHPSASFAGPRAARLPLPPAWPEGRGVRRSS